ncbi:MAG: TonB-dependent siderophore receptor, partial [Gammaproteobacteria bacterium]
LERLAFQQDSTSEYYATYLDLTGRFDTGPIQHNVLLGFDYYRDSNDYFGPTLEPPTTPPIDIFNPVYGGFVIPAQGSFPYFFRAENEEYGLYFQDQIAFWDNKLHILGGGRYDWFRNASATSLSSRAEAESRLKDVDVEHFSPRVGLLYHPWPWLGLYGSYTESVGGNNGLSATGQPFPPQQGEQYELGAKSEFFGGRLSSTLAFYHLTKQNILTSDLSTDDPFDRIAIGEARSRGIELDVAGQITDALSMIANYAYTDTEITKDNGPNQGHRLQNVPLHSGRVWAKYEVLPEHFDIGAGVSLVSVREGDNENTFKLPGYVTADAYAAYHWKLGKSRLTAQVNINNFLDKTYYSHSEPLNFFFGPRLMIFPGEPLTVLGSIRLEY